ncbi:MAG TPA: hypothetical protein VN919_06035, partial [Xanthobacteraceae bacterium]|nr:hypothetical protein [Xanthobacteraceae bacterium]
MSAQRLEQNGRNSWTAGLPQIGQGAAGAIECSGAFGPSGIFQGHAAVDDEFDAGDVARLVARE